MNALILEGGSLRFEPDRAEPDVPEPMVRVRVLQAGICETDLQLVQGYMGFSGVPGHEFVGIATSGQHAGQRVVGEINCTCRECSLCARGLGNHCSHRTVIGILNHDGAFAESLLVPAGNLHRVPDSMPDDLATLVEPVAAALRIEEQLDLSHAPDSIVLGDGRLGNLCAQALHSAGCPTQVVGKHELKLERLRRLGISTTLLGDVNPKPVADLVVDCTGSASGLALALSLVQPTGTIVLKTTVAAAHELALAPVVIDEVNVIGSRCGPFDKAIAAITSGRFDLSDFVSARYRLDQFEQAFDHARDPSALKVVFEIGNQALSGSS